MKVLKFGGTSVGTIESLRNVKNIVDALEEPGIVVVSALGGLTDGLISTARMAADGDEGFRCNMRMMASRHFDIINSLVPRERRSDVRQAVAEFLSQLEDIYMGVSLIGCLPDKVLNRIVSFGERMSSIMVANILRDAEHADPLDFIKTGKEYGRDVLAAAKTGQLISERFHLPLKRTVVTGGFISRDLYTGEITNLGRGGSDFTAALIAASLNADVLEIWTDVDGFMTADPRIVKDARVIGTMSYSESSVLCEHGAKVIYTPTIRPVMEKGIAMRVLNTHNPSAPGTLIGPDVHSDHKGVCGLACMKDVALALFDADECGDRVLDTLECMLAKHGVEIVCKGVSSDKSSFYIALKQVDADIAHRIIDDCTTASGATALPACTGFRDDLALLTVVGHSMDLLEGLREHMENSLSENGIEVVVSKHVSNNDEDFSEIFVQMSCAGEALKLLHECCFV